MAKQKTIYLDHAATTPVDKQVLKAMLPYFSDKFGNPAALYKNGVEAQKAITESRKKIAEILHTTPDTLIFTSGGTESDNLAIFGLTHANTEKPHIISIAIEHDAVLRPLEHLRGEEYEVTLIHVNEAGLVDPEEVLGAIRPETVLITIMYANNEIGTIEPIAEIGRKLLRYRKEHDTQFPYFHIDACQAAGYLDLDAEKLHVDLMTINAGKIYGPKGVGLLYVRRGVKFDPQQLGGAQESNRRAGTENVTGIVGLAKALEISDKLKKKESLREQKLLQYFWNRLQKQIPNIKLNGPEIGEHRLPNNLNVTIPGVEGEKVLLYLDSYGIACSSASACSTEGLDTSHVQRAIGRSDEEARGALRFTIGRSTTKADLDYTVTSLVKILKLLK